MTDYLEQLLPDEGELPNEQPEQGGPAPVRLRAHRPAEGAGTGAEAHAPSQPTAQAGAAGAAGRESPAPSGQGALPRRDGALLEVPPGGRGRLLPPEQAPRGGGSGTASGALSGSGRLVTEMARLRRAAERAAQPGRPARAFGGGAAVPGPVGGGARGADSVRLVDAAAQRDARRYDGGFALL